jgi:hypothetical protein
MDALDPKARSQRLQELSSETAKLRFRKRGRFAEGGVAALWAVVAAVAVFKLIVRLTGADVATIGAACSKVRSMVGAACVCLSASASAWSSCGAASVSDGAAFAAVSSSTLRGTSAAKLCASDGAEARVF